MTRLVEVSAAILLRETESGREYLLAQRPPGKVYAGYWEFPGGKLEAGESFHDALIRELHEELGIAVQAAEPWLQVRHAYPDKIVRLQVWRVTAYAGEPHGREGQPLVWALPTELGHFAFPAADQPILAALPVLKRF